MPAMIIEQLALQLQQTYEKLWETVSQLDDEEIEQARLRNGWTPKATVAHVAFWDAFQTERMRAALAGESAQSGVSWPPVDNDTRALQDADRPWDEIRAESASARRDMIQFVRGLTSEDLGRTYPEGDRSLDLVQQIRHMIDHTREHTEPIVAYCHSLHRWGRAGMKTFLERQQEDLLDAIGGLSEQSLTEVPVCGSWSTRDVLAHVLAWEEYAWAVVQQWPNPDWASLSTWLQDSSMDDVNAQLLAEKADFTMIDILDWLSTFHRRIMKQFDSLSDEELERPGDYGWGESGTLAGFLYEIAMHKAVHAVDIWQAREDGLLKPMRV
jgi:uncharacterized protein (TIGR03083 family)